MDKAVCPICETQVAKEDFKEVYVSPYNNQEYKRYECPNCDVHWWEPLKIIPEFYESEGIHGEDSSLILMHEGLRFELEHYHEAFFRYYKGKRGKLLDIGCGDGLFLKYAKRQGFEVWGIDFDNKSVERARKNLGVDTIYAMNVEDFIDYANKKVLSFDVITLFLVLEHLDRPKDIILSVKKILKNEGYLVGVVPNRDNMLRSDYEELTPEADKPPEHFLRFSVKSIQNLLYMCDFDDIEVVALRTPISYLFPFLELKYLGNLNAFKIRLRRLFFGRKSIVSNPNNENSYMPFPPRKTLFRVIKFLRNALLFPFAIPYLFKFSQLSDSIYFQARVKK